MFFNLKYWKSALFSFMIDFPLLYSENNGRCCDMKLNINWMGYFSENIFVGKTLFHCGKWDYIITLKFQMRKTEPNRYCGLRYRKSIVNKTECTLLWARAQISVEMSVKLNFASIDSIQTVWIFWTIKCLLL